MKPKQKKLAKKLDISTNAEYFQYCISSFNQGQISQCKELFAALDKEGKKALIKHIWYNEDPELERAFLFYFNLL